MKAVTNEFYLLIQEAKRMILEKENAQKTQDAVIETLNGLKKAIEDFNKDLVAAMEDKNALKNIFKTDAAEKLQQALSIDWAGMLKGEGKAEKSSSELVALIADLSEQLKFPKLKKKSKHAADLINTIARTMVAIGKCHTDLTSIKDKTAEEISDLKNEKSSLSVDNKNKVKTELLEQNRWYRFVGFLAKLFRATDRFNKWLGDKADDVITKQKAEFKVTQAKEAKTAKVITVSSIPGFYGKDVLKAAMTPVVVTAVDTSGQVVLKSEKGVSQAPKKGLLGKARELGMKTKNFRDDASALTGTVLGNK